MFPCNAAIALSYLSMALCMISYVNYISIYSASKFAHDFTGEALHGPSAIADDGARLDRRCRYWLLRKPL